MSAHTPGPWIRAKSGVSVDAGPIRIRQEAEGSHGERAANARLIAAAPDLLAALEAVCRLDGDESEDVADAAWEAAVIAIGKARGEGE